MKNKKFLTVKELQDNIKAVIRRPVPDKDIEEFNKVVERDDEYERKNTKSEPKKIAKLPEVDQ
jgi:hypothetical protein